MKITIEELYDNLNKFTNIYENGEEINPIPSDELITVYCDDSDMEEGFAENIFRDELGLNGFIAKKMDIT